MFPLALLVLFTELVGEKYGNWLNVLVLVHIIAFLIWIIKTAQESRRGESACAALHLACRFSSHLPLLLAQSLLRSCDMRSVL